MLMRALERTVSYFLLCPFLDKILTLSIDNADSVHGMPVNLQLVGRRLEDESALMMTEVIMQALS